MLLFEGLIKLIEFNLSHYSKKPSREIHFHKKTNFIFWPYSSNTKDIVHKHTVILSNF